MKIDESNYTQVIFAKYVRIGSNVFIDNGTRISAINGPAERVVIGDNVYIGENCTILVPILEVGDYCTIHKNNRISGYKMCKIGHNFWADQNCILNSTNQLEIGDNVGLGAYSQLWTHMRFGDILEGCAFNSDKEMSIGNDVWFVGHCIVSPIHAGDKSIAMVGSVVVRDMETNHIYGGCPAKDLTGKLGQPYVERPITKKYQMMLEQLEIFVAKNREDEEKIRHQIRIVTDFPTKQMEDVTYFNVKTREYSKRGSLLEVLFMKHLFPLYKFVPGIGNI